MRAKVLSLALLGAIIAVPVPASQLLTHAFSTPAQGLTAAPGDARLATLLADPFLADQLSYRAPANSRDLQNLEGRSL